MTLRLQNLMLAMLLALTTLFVGLGTLSQNPTSGGYQLFEGTASGISADIRLASLGNFAPSPETASEYANAPNTAGGERLLWGSWNDYPKVTRTGPNGPQEYAQIGDRLYSQHAVARMQPSGQRYSSGVPTEGTTPPLTGNSPPYVNQPGIQSFDGTQNVRGRSISPNHVEDIIGNTPPTINPTNGNRSYSSGDVLVVTSSEGRVITIVTGAD